MSVTVLTGPTHDQQRPSFREDVALVKSAMLYADDVKLVNPALMWASEVIQRANLPPEVLAQKELEETYNATLSAVTRPGSTRVQQNAFTLGLVLLVPNQAELEGKLKEFGLIDPGAPFGVLSRLYEQRPELMAKAEAARERTHDALHDLLDDSGHPELVALADAGGMRHVGTHNGQPHLSLNDVRIGDWTGYTEMLKRHLENPRNRLLFDSKVSSYARGLVDDGHIVPPALTVAQTKETAVGAGLVARLPSFPQASVDELLELRAELAGPLSRYRRAAAEFSDSLVYRGFDSEINAELDNLWIRKVAPAILEIKENMQEHGLVRSLARDAGVDAQSLIAGTVGGGGLWVGLATLTTLNGIVAAAGAAATAALPMVIKAATTGNVERKGARGQLHDLFYLYEMDRRSKNSH